MYHPLAWYDGYCAGCDAERPLVLVEHGPRGLRAWLAGHGPEDRTLRYSCRVCGRNEHVPLTEAEDVEYEATLQTWPDTFLDGFAPVSVSPDVVEVALLDEPARAGTPDRDLSDEGYAAAARWLQATAAPERPLAAPGPAASTLPTSVTAFTRPRPVVRVVQLPTQRVSATDDLPLKALEVAAAHVA